MSDYQNKERELKEREQELLERERQIRLREMEDELYQQEVQPPLYETSHHTKPEKVPPKWYRKMIKMGKFAGIVVAVAAAAYVGIWVAAAILVMGIAWVGYQIMFSKEKD
ncbi:MAG: hypothetical protein SXA11_25940 [Cyanobacteriota bacterium]|nr:hypothetical protein [Cyanobacteriota bacterium]